MTLADLQSSGDNPNIERLARTLDQVIVKGRKIISRYLDIFYILLIFSVDQKDEVYRRHGRGH